MRLCTQCKPRELILVCLLMTALLSTGLMGVQAQEGKPPTRAKITGEEPKGKVIGLVVDSDSQPVGEWPIIFWKAGAQGEEPYAIAVTDSEGHYQAFVPPGKYFVSPINRPSEEGKKTVHVLKGEPVSRAETVKFDARIRKKW